MSEQNAQLVGARREFQRVFAEIDALGVVGGGGVEDGIANAHTI